MQYSGCELLSNQYLCSGKNNAFSASSELKSVVNCFRISIFAVAKTMVVKILCGHTCCELLSNQYLCSGKNNLPRWRLRLQAVVNCFRISIFAVAKTIADSTSERTLSCELLSNQYLCSGKNNEDGGVTTDVTVVNCFRISIFAVAKTINTPSPLNDNKL